MDGWNILDISGVTGGRTFPTLYTGLNKIAADSEYATHQSFRISVRNRISYLKPSADLRTLTGKDKYACQHIRIHPERRPSENGI
jgi:hypothetical protein